MVPYIWFAKEASLESLQELTTWFANAIVSAYFAFHLDYRAVNNILSFSNVT
jgi:hypothetical protein